MTENLFNSAHKANSEAYREGHDRIEWEKDQKKISKRLKKKKAKPIVVYKKIGRKIVMDSLIHGN